MLRTYLVLDLLTFERTLRTRFAAVAAAIQRSRNVKHLTLFSVDDDLVLPILEAFVSNHVLESLSVETHGITELKSLIDTAAPLSYAL